MKKLINLTIKEYTQKLSKKEPTPGGGSAAALSASLGASLLIMVARYSQGRSKQKRINNKIDKIILLLTSYNNRFLELVDEDAKAYNQLVESRKKSAKEQRAAQKYALAVPKEVCKLVYNTINQAPYLVEHGNPYLIADVQSAVEMLKAAFVSAQGLVDYNSSS